jgi:flagellar hook assembly protein FlgD
MKKLIVLAACLLALTSQPVLAQTGGPDVVVVRVEEYSGHAHLTIERAGKEPEEIEFNWNPKVGKGERASKGYYDALAKLYQQGYQVQATIPGATSNSGTLTYTTLVFIKPVGK